MRALLQRAGKSAVSIKKDGEYEFKEGIEKGFVILLAVCDEDTDEDMNKLVDKIVKLRVFEDENGKTNLSLRDVGGELLLVSQFTLLANCKEGNRPSFIGAGSPDEAKRLYEYMVELGKSSDIHTECGVFGADMKVSLENDGPFTIVLEL